MTSGFLKGRGLAPLWVALSALGLSGAARAADATPPKASRGALVLRIAATRAAIRALWVHSSRIKWPTRALRRP